MNENKIKITDKRPWTAGPWKAVTIDCDDFDDGTYVMMDTRLTNPDNYRCAHEWKCDSVNEPEALANARLMAAAPDMYDYLQSLKDTLSELGECHFESSFELCDHLTALADSVEKILRAANPSAFGEGET